MSDQATKPVAEDTGASKAPQDAGSQSQQPSSVPSSTASQSPAQGGANTYQNHGHHNSNYSPRYNNNKNYNNRQNNNRQPYNKRNYNNKMNSGQNINYNPAAQAAYQMNMMNYYYGYPNYGMPVPMYSPTGQPIVTSPTNSYVSPTPTAQPTGNAIKGGMSPVAPPATAPIGKVKLTDKSGKEINLEEKMKHLQKSSSATPISSPKKSFASPVRPPVTIKSPIRDPATIAPVPAFVPAAAVPPVVPALGAPVLSAPVSSNTTPASTASPEPVVAPAAATPAAAAGKDSAIEEFRERIRQRALAVAKEKEEKERAAKGGSKPVEPVAQPKTEVKEPEAVKPKEEKKEEKIEEPKAEEPKVEEPKVAEPKAEEPKAEEPKAEEPKAEEPKEEPKEAPKAVETTQSTQPVEPAVSSAVETTNAESKSAENDEEDDGDDEEEEGEGENDAESVPEMDLSQFFDKIKEATPITDPFSMKYPEPLVGVDGRWKTDSKKFRYDPQFLMQFKDVVTFEVDEEWKTKLLSLGIVAQNHQRRYGGSQRGGSNRGGLPNRYNQMSGRGGSFDGRQNSRNGSKRKGGSSRDKSKRNPQSKRKDKDDEPKISIPPEEIKPLEKTANRWVPRRAASKTAETKLAPDGVTVILDEEEIERKVKSLLNKLTLEMFEPITDDILKLTEQSKWEEDAKTVKQIISLTFAKACDEPYWSSMYAQFCAKMCSKISTDIAVKEDGVVKFSGGDLARRLLLSTCQKEYEKGWSDKLNVREDGSAVEMMSDEYYALAAAKRRGLGLVKFIGQLYLLNMLTDRVVIYCLTNLSKNVEDPSEDSLESLSQLVTAVGPKFERTESNKRLMDIVFDCIKKILENVKLPSRIKFMLLDLQDLRKANWVSKKAETGPKTIKEIHDDAEIKKLEEEKAALERRRNNKGGFNDSRSNSSRGGSNWGSQPPKRVESSSKIAPIRDSKGFTAVSRSQSSRVENSLSPRDNSKRSESLQSATNMFAALGGEDEQEHDNDNEEATNEEATNEATNEATEEPSDSAI